MKKQTFEILPVSPEEKKHLIGLSYNEIGDILQAKDFSTTKYKKQDIRYKDSKLSTNVMR